MPSPQSTKPRLLIIDNYDSYTFNLFQYFTAADKMQQVIVIRNDQFTWYAHHIIARSEFQNIECFFD